MRGLLETAFDTIFTVADAGSLVEGTDRLQPTVIVVDLAVANVACVEGHRTERTQ
jgi:hypothetical protein